MHMDESELELSDLDKLAANDEAFLREVREGTSSLPGSDRKVDILMVRYASGLPMHHPEDRVPQYSESVYKGKYDDPFSWALPNQPDELSEAQEEID